MKSKMTVICVTIAVCLAAAVLFQIFIPPYVSVERIGAEALENYPLFESGELSKNIIRWGEGDKVTSDSYVGIRVTFKAENPTFYDMYFNELEISSAEHLSNRFLGVINPDAPSKIDSLHTGYFTVTLIMNIDGLGKSEIEKAVAGIKLKTPNFYRSLSTGIGIVDNFSSPMEYSLNSTANIQYDSDVLYELNE